ncbi:MAG TPA: exodeoxyribonuclease V subunit beta, partial [Verrucomicrobiae bacterium]|nr:exodeoxyribonuclease V subunit beta [Verrucomicrobiae bacterium]
VTRAIHRCCFVWGGFKSAGSSAPAWLFHQPATIDEPKIEELNAQFADLSDNTMRAQLNELANASADSVQIQDLPEPASERYRPPEQSTQALTCREFTGKIPRDWFITSFSFLTAGREEDLHDRDNVPLPAKEAESGSGIFGFPRGVRPGTCLHEIFQQLDFAGTQEAAAPIIEEKLRIHRLFTADRAAAVGEMLDKVFHTPLEPKQPDFTLSHVPMNERLNELEFHFPVEKIALPKLHNCLVEFGKHDLPPRQMDRHAFDVSSGFLKGFIDVAFRFDGRFYIADWKSNWLGNHAEDYHADALRAEMQRHFYFLQYHLYVAALHKYLALHLPDYDYEKHFGGVFYVFLRGVEAARPELGIFRDRPSFKLLQRFCAVLDGH